MWRNRISTTLFVVLLAVVGPSLTAQDTTAASDWRYFGGNKAFTRYAPLDQIDGDNVGELRVLWRRAATDPAFTVAFPDRSVSGNLRSTPVLIGDVLYAPNALGLVEAFHPGTGETIWRQPPFDASPEEAFGRSSRGVDYWADGSDGRLLSVRGAYLYALDPATGRPLPDFGDGGRVNLIPDSASSYSWSSGPIVVGDVVVIGGVVDGGGDSGMKWRATGARIWHFQMVHHDLWEYDTVGPPTLGDITVDGRTIRAVMQPSKTGFLYVFDRETGEPVWPIIERPVPQSTVPGEQTSPTQPFPTKPAPFAQHGVTEDDLIDFTPELRRRALELANTFVLGDIRRLRSRDRFLLRLRPRDPQSVSPGESHRFQATGEVLWETELPTGVTGAPMTYMFGGTQYIVVPTGGRDDPPEWVALGLGNAQPRDL